MKYINNVIINNPDFDFYSLEDIEIKNLFIKFSKFNKKQMIDFYNEFFKQEKIKFRDPTKREFSSQLISLAKKLKHDSELLNILFEYDFKDDFKFENYIRDFFDGSNLIDIIENGQFKEPFIISKYVGGLLLKSPHLISKEKLEYYESIIVNAKNIPIMNYVEKYLTGYYNNPGNREMYFNIKNNHPQIYNYFVNKDKVNGWFITKYGSERLSSELEDLLFELNGRELIDYIVSFVGERVPKYEKSIFKSGEFYTIKIYFEKVVIPFYLEKIENKTLKKLQQSFDNELKDFVSYFERNTGGISKIILEVIYNAIIIFTKDLEELHDFFNSNFPKLMNTAKNEPKVFYDYCLKYYKKPWRDGEKILLKDPNHTYEYSGYTIIFYLENVVLPYYNNNFKEMIKDYQEFEDAILNQFSQGNRHVIVDYMLSVRGRWPEAEKLLKEYAAKITDGSDWVKHFIQNQLESLKDKT
jgi:hypothetical protein